MLKNPTTQDSPTASTFKHPSIELIHNALQHKTRPKVLDLGSLSTSSFNYFRTHKYHIRFECFNELLEEEAASSNKKTTDELIKEIDEFLLPLKKNEKFDAILTWDLFCHLSKECIKHLCHRLSEHCHTGTKLQVLRYWSSRYPSKPCEFKIINQHQISNNYARSQLKHAHKLMPTSQLKQFLPQFTLSHQFIEAIDMHPAMTEAVFTYCTTADISHKNRNTYDNKKSATLPKTEYYIDPNGSLRHESYGLRQLLTAPSKPLRILDLGSYNANNAAQLKTMGHSVFFVNLPYIMHHLKTHKENSLPSLLPLRPSQVFDAVLSWDFLCHYTPKETAIIMQLLQPHIHAKSLMHIMQYVGNKEDQTPRINCKLQTGVKAQSSGHNMPTNISPLNAASALKSAPNSNRNELSQTCQINLLHPKKTAHSNPVTHQAAQSIHSLNRAINGAKIESSFMFKAGMQPNISEYIIRIKKPSVN